MTTELNPIRRVCAWCNLHLGGPRDAKLVSHGICEPCAAKWMENLNLKEKGAA